MKNNPKLCFLIDEKLVLLDSLQQYGMYCFRSALKLENKKIAKILIDITMMNLKQMEEIAKLTHQLRGIDVMYLDGSYNDVLCYETIDQDLMPLVKIENDYNDIRIALKMILVLQEDLLNRLNIVKKQVENDNEIAKMIKKILNEQNKYYHIIKTIFDYFETNLEIKTFNENQFDLDSGNYFDKLTPYYLK